MAAVQSRFIEVHPPVRVSLRTNDLETWIQTCSLSFEGSSYLTSDAFQGGKITMSELSWAIVMGFVSGQQSGFHVKFWESEP